MNIYVGNLDFKVDENDLKGIFEEYGSVNEVKIITDKYSGQSKGFGFVTIDNSTQGKQAIDELNGTVVENRKIVVNEARQKNDSSNTRRY